jgi:hypothetical protein
MQLSTDQMNELMKNISANIPTNCGAYEDIRRKSERTNPILGINKFKISDYQAYRNDIEFTNSFMEQVLIDEKQYLENKYGSKVYKYLLERRKEYIDKQKKLLKERLCILEESDELDENGNPINEVNTCAPNTCNNPKHDKFNENANFLQYFLDQTKSTFTTPETTFKKIEYRNEAHEWLVTINRIMTILYFVILVSMIALLVVTNRLDLKSQTPLFVILIVLPFVFPYLFQGLQYLYESVFPNTPTQGPKNAFLASPQTPLVESL